MPDEEKKTALEKAIEKVKKLQKLAGNNPNQNEKVDAAMLPYNASGSYSPSARRASLALLKKHGWTEAEYQTAWEKRNQDFIATLP
jgi:hypothetical protein